MKVTVIFSEQFEVDPNSPLSPEEQGEQYIQELLDNKQLRVNGDALVDIEEPYN